MSRVLIVGSTAMQYYLDGGIQPNDTDIIASYEDAMWYIKRKFNENHFNVVPVSDNKIVATFKRNIIEAEIAWPGSTAASLLNLEHLQFYDPIQYASLAAQLAMKQSHRYLKNSPHFLKTRNDILRLRNSSGIAVLKENIALQEWQKAREAETYNYSHPKLNQSKANFFSPNQGISYQYDHDSLHEAVAVNPLGPAYRFFAKPGAAVQSDKNSFMNLDEATRLNAVLEESYVLALERSQIPFGILSAAPLEWLTPRKSFEMALEKVCTSITSGWFREFAWENYDAVLALYNPNYINKFIIGLSNGTVKPYSTPNT